MREINQTMPSGERGHRAGYEGNQTKKLRGERGELQGWL